jgi:hypothetical protein
MSNNIESSAPRQRLRGSFPTHAIVGLGTAAGGVSTAMAGWPAALMFSVLVLAAAGLVCWILVSAPRTRRAIDLITAILKAR